MHMKLRIKHQAVRHHREASVYLPASRTDTACFKLFRLWREIWVIYCIIQPNLNSLFTTLLLHTSVSPQAMRKFYFNGEICSAVGCFQPNAGRSIYGEFFSSFTVLFPGATFPSMGYCSVALKSLPTITTQPIGHNPLYYHNTPNWTQPSPHPHEQCD
jgi:hypothetical protein